MGTVKVRGYRAARAAPSALRTRGVKVEVRAELRPAALRSGTEAAVVETIDDQDLLEVELDGGLRLWVTGEEYRERTAPSGARGAPDGGAIDLAAHWTVPGAAEAERGLGTLAIKSLKLLGIDLAGATAAAIARRFEDGTPGDPKRPGPGFYRCRLATGAFRLEPVSASDVPLARPVLVLVHGTASSTWGSFGDLWSPQRRETLERLRARYGEQVFALEHRSFTESVIDNALALARALPAGARVDLLTHSRGGLVGELFARANFAAGEAPFDANEIALAGRLRDLDRRRLTAAERRAVDASLAAAQARLAELGATLVAKRLAVGRFVRVACPALGTSLVSGRLDRWLAVIGNVGALALAGTPLAEVADALGDFIAAVVKEKTDPTTLPGLAFFLPDAGLIHALNAGRGTLDSRLAVIAGDVEPAGLWQRLYTLVLDRFYDGEHDLVVNTGSMYGGARRRPGEALLSFHSGPAVNHFNYFANADSAEALARALATPPGQPIPGFEPLRPAVPPIARGVHTRAAGTPAGYVYLLPGITGSELEVDGERIWVSVPKLMAGGLARIAIDAPGVVASAPYAPAYAVLAEALAQDHKVIAFPYDWRLAPEIEADRLAAAVRRTLADAQRDDRPLSFLAHSMGGLVVRAMIARHPELWREVKAHPRSRLLMLGTPNGGSHSIVELLVGKADTLDYLSLLDLQHSPEALLRIMVRFPGILALLPADENLKWFEPETWSLFRAGEGGAWPVPDAADLARALALRKLLDASPFEPDRMCYVAGQAPATIDRVTVGEFKDFARQAVAFEATRLGDGRVTWASGIPPGVPTWYMPVAHGDMAAATDHFPALFDLLERGTTARLPQTPPVAAGAARRFAFSRAPAQSLPDERALAAAALGAGTGRAARRRRAAPPIAIRVLHGDLAFAADPVLVGHYAGDTIVSAEAALDAALGGLLREQHRVGRYPGPLETSEVFAVPVNDGSGRRRGAIVVGLGRAGELAVQPLRRTLTHALLQYATRLARRAREEGAAAPASMQEIGLTALLVGTNAGGVRVVDSVMALVEAAAQANQALEAAEIGVRIARLELLELWEDRALQAVEALKLLGQSARLRAAFSFDGRLVAAKGARRRTRFAEPGGWWQRLQIKGASAAGEPADGTLRFLNLTRRARAESRTAGTQAALVGELVRRAIGDTRDNRELGTTLFELLLPNELKEEAPERDNLLLVVDEAAARYPWELLEDRADARREPLAVGRGLLRQLESAAFRAVVRGATEDAALVVGDPLLPAGEAGGLPPLEGAREEAALVAERLASGGFDARTLIQPSANEVVTALFERPYRILHLAGHGVYQHADPTRPGAAPATGMVIGDGVYLTPAEVEQMRIVPEFVFINCCHLGRVEGARGGARERWNELAANVSAQFIRMGVRAVVAAGWAVNDLAAKTFAATFYDRLLGGATFGEAVKEARHRTWERHCYSNTWGAYQCYGDPDYRLRAAAGGGGEARPVEFASVAEAANEIENVRHDLSVRASEPTGPALERLRSLRAAIAEHGWAREARLWTELARAYGEAQQFDQAAACYGEALALDDAALAVKDLEQLSNYESRGALLAWRAAGAGDAEPFVRSVARAIARLEWLRARDPEPRDADGERFARSDTVERFELLASAHKRRAWIDAAARLESLRRSYEHYDAALRLARRLGDPTVNPLLNRLQTGLARAWQGDRAAPPVTAGDRAALREAEAALRASLAGAPDFWTAVGLADHRLTEALLDGTLPAAVDALVQRYLEARRLGSQREFASVLDQIEFLAAMARDATVRDALGALAARLGGGAAPTGAAAPAPRPARRRTRDDRGARASRK
jgi:tetratricopeptide (TPR) repeat protein